jgi:acetolactate synthase regulatory subunit
MPRYVTTTVGLQSILKTCKPRSFSICEMRLLRVNFQRQNTQLINESGRDVSLTTGYMDVYVYCMPVVRLHAMARYLYIHVRKLACARDIAVGC